LQIIIKKSVFSISYFLYIDFKVSYYPKCTSWKRQTRWKSRTQSQRSKGALSSYDSVATGTGVLSN